MALPESTGNLPRYGVFLRDPDGHNVEAVYYGGHDAHGQPARAR